MPKPPIIRSDRNSSWIIVDRMEMGGSGYGRLLEENRIYEIAATGEKTKLAIYFMRKILDDEI